MIKRLLFTFIILTTWGLAQALTVSNTAGNLSKAVTDKTVTALTVNGSMNALDFEFIRNNLTQLASLDIKDVTIEPLAKESASGMAFDEFNYDGNVLPQGALMGMTRLQTVVLPAGITRIDYAAMAGCSRLKEIAFPAKLQEIGAQAFNACTALTAAEVGGVVERVGAGAFARCAALRQVTLNSTSRLSVGDEAFMGCSALTTLTVGAMVDSIGDRAFAHCTKLQRLDIAQNSLLAHIGDQAFYNSALKELDMSGTAQLRHLGAWALAKTPIEEVDIPAQVKSIDEGVLFYNTSLKKITMPRALTYMPDFMLAGCNRLNISEGTLPLNLGSIGDYALYNITGVPTVTIPYKVYYIGTQAMAGMTGLNTLTSNALEVPELGDDVWAGINCGKVTLNVDRESVTSYKEAEQWKEFLIMASALRGDVNDDNRVNADDVTSERLYITSGTTQGINVNATDVNGDNAVDVADVVSIYNIINGTLPAATPIRMVGYATLEHKGEATSSNEVKSEFELANTTPYTAFQMTIVLPQGMTLDNVKGTSRTLYHEIYAGTQGGEYILLGYSPTGEDIEGNSGAFITFVVKNGNAIKKEDSFVVKDMIFVDRDENVYTFTDREFAIIGLSAIDDITAEPDDAPVDVYNMQGQLIRAGVIRSEATHGLPQGIYLVGGKKVLVK